MKTFIRVINYIQVVLCVCLLAITLHSAYAYFTDMPMQQYVGLQWWIRAMFNIAVLLIAVPDIRSNFITERAWRRDDCNVKDDELPLSKSDITLANMSIGLIIIAVAVFIFTVWIGLGSTQPYQAVYEAVFENLALIVWVLPTLNNAAIVFYKKRHGATVLSKHDIDEAAKTDETETAGKPSEADKAPEVVETAKPADTKSDK